MAKRFHLLMPLFAFSHSGSLVTWTDLSWPYRWGLYKRWRKCHSSVDISCKAHGVLDLCACSNHTDRECHACWTTQPDSFFVVHNMSVHFVLILWPEILMLNHILIAVTSPCSAHALAQACPTMSCIPLVYFQGWVYYWEMTILGGLW